MILNIKQVNGKYTAVDSAGNVLQFDTLDIQEYDGRHLLQLGTFDFELSVKIGSDATATPTQTPTQTPAS